MKETWISGTTSKGEPRVFVDSREAYPEVPHEVDVWDARLVMRVEERDSHGVYLNVFVRSAEPGILFRYTELFEVTRLDGGRTPMDVLLEAERMLQEEDLGTLLQARLLTHRETTVTQHVI